MYPPHPRVWTIAGFKRKYGSDRADFLRIYSLPQYESINIKKIEEILKIVEVYPPTDVLVHCRFLAQLYSDLAEFLMMKLYRTKNARKTCKP